MRIKIGINLYTISWDWQFFYLKLRITGLPRFYYFTSTLYLSGLIYTRIWDMEFSFLGLLISIRKHTLIPKNG